MKLSTPIDFPVKIGGENLTATLFEVVDNDEYHVKFSDGHQDIFYVSEADETGEIILIQGNSSIKPDYAQAIIKDIVPFTFPFPWEIAFNFRTEGKNTWILGAFLDGVDVYEIFLNGKLQIEFKRFGSIWAVDPVNPTLPPSDLEILANEAKVFLKKQQYTISQLSKN